MMPPTSTFTRSVVAVAVVLTALSQSAPSRAATNDDFGSLVVNFDHAKWPSPELIVKDLRSPDEDVRFKALQLIGLSEKAARLPIWSSTNPSVAIGSRVVKVEQIELRYAALGPDTTQQAILVVQVEGQLAFAAIATPGGNGWERIGVFDYWCKYDKDVMDTFVSIVHAPDPTTDPETGHYELAVRASGGGTGTYGQNEVHFRLYHGELKAVISFVSRLRHLLNQGTPEPLKLRIERRWFHPSVRLDRPDGKIDAVAVMVESQGELPVPPTVGFVIDELLDRNLKSVTCRTFIWDDVHFEYRPLSAPDVCQ